jgi:endonuclease/exonuclease/phosphatase family metal-dependent hydrolase
VDLRVLVYNVRHFRNGLARAAEVAGRTGPDIALIQECGTRWRLRRFAHALGMEAVHGPLPPLLRRVRDAVLVRPPWRVVSRRTQVFEPSERFHPRGATAALVGRSGLRLWAVSAHLGLVQAERRRHAQELTDFCGTLRGPVAIGGDLNEGPDGAATGWIAGRFVDVWVAAGVGAGETFPATEAAARIDYLFVSAGIEVRRAEVKAGGAVIKASDHRPLVVDLVLSG